MIDGKKAKRRPLTRKAYKVRRNTASIEEYRATHRLASALLAVLLPEQHSLEEQIEKLLTAKKRSRRSLAKLHRVRYRLTQGGGGRYPRKGT